MSTFDWQFDQPPNCAVFTLRSILFNNAPILHVTHDANDHGWQFLGRETPDFTQAAIAALSEVLELDPSLLQLADLPRGWHAWRQSKSSPWECEKMRTNNG